MQNLTAGARTSDTESVYYIKSHIICYMVLNVFITVFYFLPYLLRLHFFTALR